MLKTPPNVVDGGWAMLPELLKGAGRWRGGMNTLDMTGKRDLLALFARSAGDMLDDWFESDLVKALFGFDAIVGNYASPYAAGSAYVMLHHAFGEVNGKKGVWGHAIGGMGAITQAMAACAPQRRRHPRDVRFAKSLSRRAAPWVSSRKRVKPSAPARWFPISIPNFCSAVFSIPPPCPPISASASHIIVPSRAPSA